MQFIDRLQINYVYLKKLNQSSRVYREVHERDQERKERLMFKEAEELVGGGSLHGIDPSWDHPVFLKGLEEKRQKGTMWPCLWPFDFF